LGLERCGSLDLGWGSAIIGSFPGFYCICFLLFSFLCSRLYFLWNACMLFNNYKVKELKFYIKFEKTIVKLKTPVEDLNTN
jgi:hypothetical protein